MTTVNKVIKSYMLLTMVFLVVIGFNGCAPRKLIHISTSKNGLKSYFIGTPKLNFQTLKYKNNDIQTYFISFNAEGDKVKVKINNYIRPNIGTGIPKSLEPFYLRFEWFNILGVKNGKKEILNPISRGKVKYTHGSIFAIYSENITNVYKKDDFIKFFEQYPDPWVGVKINSKYMYRGYNLISSKIIKIEDVHKFIKCLKNSNFCKL